MRSLASVGLLGLACCILMIGVALRDGALLSLLLPLLLILILERAIAAGPKGSVEVDWMPLEEEKFMEGDEVDISLRIFSQGFNGSVLVDVSLPSDVVLEEGRGSFSLWLRPGEVRMLKYHFSLPRRGNYRFGPVQIRRLDLLQMRMDERTLDKVIGLKVMPIIYDLRRCDLMPSKVRQHSGNVRSRMLGAGSEFFGLRDYLSGDPWRTINWKASARSGPLVVNEHESERSGDVVVVLDAREEASGKVRSMDLVDHEVSAAASFSEFYLRQRDRVGLMILSDHVELIKPSFGRHQFYRIVETLTEVRPAGERSSISIRLAMQRFFSPQSLILYITPLDDESTIQVIKELSVRGFQVVVVSPFIFTKGDDLADDLDFRLRRLSREDRVFDLRRFCHVVDWDTSQPLSRYVVRVRGWHLRG